MGSRTREKALMPEPARQICDNMNHRRANAPVGYCPQCGRVVNEQHRSRGCDEREHNAARRTQTTFCVTCGTRLIFER